MQTEKSKEELKSIKNEYFRNWRKANPTKVKEINERFWNKKLQQKKERLENQRKEKNLWNIVKILSKV